MTVDVSKLTAYAVVEQGNLDVSKLTAYAVLENPAEENVKATLIVAEPLTGGNPQVQSPLIVAEPLTGGNSVVRCSFIVVEVFSQIPEEPPVATDIIPLIQPINAPLIARGLPGLTYSSHKKPMWRTDVAEAVSGREVRTARMQVPKWKFEIKFDFLDSRDTADPTEQMETLAGFFCNMKGRWANWLYSDPTDYMIRGQELGVGDGGETSFYILHKFKTYVEPIGQVDLANLMTFDAASVNAGTDTITVVDHGLETGYGPVRLSNADTLPTGLAANVNYWLIVTNDSQFQLASSYANAIAGTEVDITGAGSGTNTMRNGVAVYLDGTEVSPDDYTVGTNAIVFDTAPADPEVITADCKFYFVCRFMEDEADFEQFMHKLWTLETMEFITDIL